MSLGKHPVAGLAVAFSGVAAVFGVERIITPIDDGLTGLTKDAIHHAIVARPQHWVRRRSTAHRAVSAARSYKCHA
jgi:p-aminobenzoyl-glutamate transporter AbgT